MTLPQRWTAAPPSVQDAAELTRLLRRHEQAGRGWASASVDDVRLEVSSRTRTNVAVRDAGAVIRGWASAHDRAAGRMLLVVVVDRRLEPQVADDIASWLFGWGDDEARRIGAERGLDVQQVDSGAFVDDRQQYRWLARAGFAEVRHWWQMSRPVSPEDADIDCEPKPGVRIRQVGHPDGSMPDEADLRTVHDVLESAFADHFNSHEETFEEFLARLRGDPGHRWDHWWVAELVDGPAPEPAGALVASVSPGSGDAPDGSYVDYIGVLQNARGRGVAKSLLRTVVADAAARGRDRVGLEVDADSPTRADGLYLSMGWVTRYVTGSWHRSVPVEPRR